MKTKYFLVIGMLALMIFGEGCSTDDPTDPLNEGCDKSRSWGEQTKPEADAVNSKAMTFANNPSKVTCEDFRAAYINYIEALEKVNTCILEENEAAFLKALQEGKAELENINCNQNFQ